MPNARCGPSSRWGPAWFELRHGLPIALGVLVRRFGILGALGVLARVARRRQRADPVAGAPPGRLGAAQERASLSQPPHHRGAQACVGRFAFGRSAN